MKYRDWTKIWVESYLKLSVKVRTCEKYERTLRLHVLPMLGESELTDIKSTQVQNFIAQKAEHYSSGTVNGIVPVLIASLKAAQRAEIPCNLPLLQRPPREEKKVECFSVKEQKLVEQEALKDMRGWGVIICLYTGLRLGELLALEWRNVNLKTGIITVEKSCHFGKDSCGNYSRIAEKPKTRSSCRIIPLTRQLITLLSKLKKAAATPYVIEVKGKPANMRTYQYSFAVLLKRLNIPHRGFHTLRHTFATRAIESGMDVRTLADILGHKDPKITLQRYAHSLMEHKFAMMNKLGKYCGLCVDNM